MAIDQIKLAANLNAPNTWYNGIRIRNGASTPNHIFVTWHTEKYAPDGTNPCHARFIIKTRWVGIKKGADPVYGSYPAVYKSNEVERANCLYRRDGSGAIWRYDIASLLPTSDPYGDFRSNSSWSFGNRLYDEIKIELTIYAEYDTQFYDWDNGYSPSSIETLYIGYFPNYQITRVARSGTDDILIEYEADGWTRCDDRYELEIFASNATGNSLINPYWTLSANSIGEIGHIYLSAQQFTRVPNVGESVHLRVRWNAAYKPPGLEFSGDEDDFTVGGGTVAEDITAEFMAVDGSIEAFVSNTAYSEVSVSIDGERWSFDIVDATVSSAQAVALLEFPPLGVDFTIEVVGHRVITSGGTSTDVYSGSFVQTMRVDPESCYWINPIDPRTGKSNGLPPIKALGNPKWDVTEAQEFEIKKFSGRMAPTALYGFGHARGMKLEFDIPPYQAATESGFDGVMYLHEAQVVVIRSPRGERYVAAIKSVQHSKPYDSILTHVTVEAEEVVL